MSCHGNNATPPSPAIAPGCETIDPAAAAIEIGGPGGRGMDPRVLAVSPTFDAPFFQAGLAGYSDAAMRLIARRHGCPFCVTEALLDRMLLGGGHGFDKADLELIRDNLPSGEDDLPLSGQIIGSDPDEMAAAALKMVEQSARADTTYRAMAYARTGLPDPGTDPRMRGFPSVTDDDELDCCGVDHLTDNQPFSIAPQRSSATAGESNAASPASPAGHTFTTIDVNLACPVKKIKNKARGGHWLSEPDGAIDILRAVRDALPPSVACTVKLRRAFDDTPAQARNFHVIFDAAFELGYAWATVHARTVEQKYIGPSRWTFLRDLVKRRPDCVVFGSGDVWNVADIFRMIAYTGVSAVSVARGCIGNPWIFRQAREMMAGQSPTAPTIAEQRWALEEHFRLAVKITGEHAASRMMRKFGIRFSAHHPLAEEVRLRMIAVTCTAEWLSVLNEFYKCEADAVPVAAASV